MNNYIYFYIVNEREINALYRELGLRIAKIRKSQQLNQEDFGKQFNLSRTSVVNIEKGRQRPSIHLLYDIKRSFNIKIEDLIPDTFLSSEQDTQAKIQNSVSPEVSKRLLDLVQNTL